MSCLVCGRKENIISLKVSREESNQSDLWPEKWSNNIHVCNTYDVRELITTKLKKAVQRLREPVVTKTKPLSFCVSEDWPVCVILSGVFII